MRENSSLMSATAQSFRGVRTESILYSVILAFESVGEMVRYEIVFLMVLRMMAIELK
jgi:hypothetical protein